jgi:hypothetical protein
MEKWDTLPLVRSVVEIQKNAETLGAYLQKPNGPENRKAKAFVIANPLGRSNPARKHLVWIASRLPRVEVLASVPFSPPMPPASQAELPFAMTGRHI